jgi:hypothetical protein
MKPFLGPTTPNRLRLGPGQIWAQRDTIHKQNRTQHRMLAFLSSNRAGGHRKSTQHSEKTLNEKALNIAQPLGARAPDYAK